MTSKTNSIDPRSLSVALTRGRRVMEQHYTAVGIDPSLTCTGLAAVRLAIRSTNRPRLVLLKTANVETVSDDRLATRLCGIVRGINAFIEQVPGHEIIGVEGLSFGSKFRDPVVMAHTCAQIAAGESSSYDCRIETITPQQVKAIACPHWPGFSIKNWKRAGYTRKFKRSMPQKADVVAGLHKRFGLIVTQEDRADATCIAIAALARISRESVDTFAKE